MRRHNPPHPGEIIKTLCLEPLGLTVTQTAEGLGVSRKTLSAILNGRAGVSAEMAVRLSIAFGTSSESWLLRQNLREVLEMLLEDGEPKLEAEFVGVQVIQVA